MRRKTLSIAQPSLQLLTRIVLEETEGIPQAPLQNFGERGLKALRLSWNPIPFHKPSSLRQQSLQTACSASESAEESWCTDACSGN